jgi:hypothetical protein
LQDPHLQNNQSKTDWRHGSSSRKPALQAQSPELNPSPTKKNKKKKKKKPTENRRFPRPPCQLAKSKNTSIYKDQDQKKREG